MEFKHITKEKKIYIKNIGRGSFSSVALYKLEKNDFLFIIKEMDLNQLAEKYCLQKDNHINEQNKKEIFKYYYKKLEDLIDSEIDILKKMDHDNIIKLYGYTKKSSIYNLYMEYCDSGDANEYLKKNCIISERNILGGVDDYFLNEFIKQTIDAIDYIHKMNIIHRDIKLHNILITHCNNVLVFKLSDFGFACYDLSENGKEKLDDKMYNKYFRLCGTPLYMAPEIIFNINYFDSKKSIVHFFYNKKIDIWSYGICLYEIIFNNVLFTKNLTSINDLNKFYKENDIQNLISKKIMENKIIDINIKRLLLSILKLNQNERYSIVKLKSYKEYEYKTQSKVKTDSEIKNILSNHNQPASVIVNELKKHIITKPLKRENDDNNNEYENENDDKNEYDEYDDDSWEKINKISYMITKIGLKDEFLEWLSKDT